MGLTLEGWMYFPQLPELADFAKAVPDLTIILNHIGGLLRTGPTPTMRKKCWIPGARASPPLRRLPTW